MVTLSDFVAQFRRLGRASGAFPEETLRRAPHKPFLLLSVADLIQAGIIKNPFIDIRGDLNELNELFADYWGALFPPGRTTSIAFPFSRLNREPFWELVSIDGNPISSSIINGISSVNQLRAVAIGARLNQHLFGFLTFPDEREALTEALLDSCFSPEGRTTISNVVATHRGSFQYGLFLEHKVRNPNLQEPRISGNYSEARSRGFRFEVIKHYDKRCALCGVKIITPEGRSAVDAAHIKPWSISHDDSIGNGMALCKLCHWSFDNGLIGVSEDYRIILSSQISAHPNAAGLLITLDRRDIVGPAEEAYWPDQQNLSWHRTNWNL